MPLTWNAPRDIETKSPSFSSEVPTVVVASVRGRDHWYRWKGWKGCKGGPANRIWTHMQSVSEEGGWEWEREKEQSSGTRSGTDALKSSKVDRTSLSLLWTWRERSDPIGHFSGLSPTPEEKRRARKRHQCCDGDRAAHHWTRAAPVLPIRTIFKSIFLEFYRNIFFLL